MSIVVREESSKWDEQPKLIEDYIPKTIFQGSLQKFCIFHDSHSMDNNIMEIRHKNGSIKVYERIVVSNYNISGAGGCYLRVAEHSYVPGVTYVRYTPEDSFVWDKIILDAFKTENKDIETIESLAVHSIAARDFLVINVLQDHLPKDLGKMIVSFLQKIPFLRTLEK